jgi:SLT domain-containing protein
MLLLKNKIFVPAIIAISFFTAGCLHYTLKESSIPKEVKTIRINYIENRARYVNPQLGPQLTDKLRQKINNQTNRTLVQGDNADYDITGTITDYSFSTSGIADNRSATNRLSITVHIKLLNRLDEKKNIDADVSRSFEFDANISVQQAEQQLNESIIKNLTDEIFNRIFSNW